MWAVKQTGSVNVEVVRQSLSVYAWDPMPMRNMTNRGKSFVAVTHGNEGKFLCHNEPLHLWKIILSY